MIDHDCMYKRYRVLTLSHEPFIFTLSTLESY